MPIIPKSKNAIARLEQIENYLYHQCKPSDLSILINEATSLSSEFDRGCLLRMFRSYLTASALSDWYRRGDVNRVKNLFYTIGKLEYLRFVQDWDTGTFHSFSYTHAIESMPILISDHSGLIEWCAVSNFGLADNDNKDKFHTSTFFVKTLFLAMRKQWHEVEERCRRYTENPRRRPFSRMDIFEYQYLLALATGDTRAMENNLSEFVSPRGLRTNSSSESGMTDGLISTFGLLFAKLAWMNGYEVNINSPYIPQEWLPVQPLDHYEDEFDFMEAYTIDPTKGATSI